jgi:glutamate synthase domain-containing protein 1
MCGIVGLFLKDPSLEPELGRLTEGMLATLSDRGPDSAGFAVYGEGRGDETKLTLRASSAEAMKEIAERIGHAFSDATIELHDTHAVIAVEHRSLPRLNEWLACEAPEVDIVGRGKRMALFKEVGLPEKVAERFGPCSNAGHTRHRSHPHGDRIGGHDRRRPSLFDRLDQCLVHNGSLSNHNNIRRVLAARGLRLRDRERHRGRGGLSQLEDARRAFARRRAQVSLDDLDGFYTFVVGTENGFGVLPRWHRLQAGDHGRDRSLRRIRL